MQDLDIFIFGHEVPKVYPKSPEYKLVSIDPIEEPCEIEKISLQGCDDPILKMEHAYSEGARMHALWKNYPLKKYVGTAHYRRYFEFFDKVPDLNEIFATHDAVYQNFDIGWENLLINYKCCHNIKDILLCRDIINEKYPEYEFATRRVLENKFFVPCNIFILKREDFCRWCEFVFGILDEYNKRMGFETDLDVTNHVVNHMDEYVDNKGGLPNASTAYQARIHAFLMERLSTIFFYQNIHKPYHEDIVLTEIHFDFEKTYFCQYEK